MYIYINIYKYFTFSQIENVLLHKRVTDLKRTYRKCPEPKYISKRVNKMK